LFGLDELLHVLEGVNGLPDLGAELLSELDLVEKGEDFGEGLVMRVGDGELIF
jgi:hypothetical protein